MLPSNAPVPLLQDLSLNWLPSDSRLLLRALTAIVPSTARTDSYDVQCEFVELEPNAERGDAKTAFAPIEQILLLRPGCLFENKRQVGAMEGLTILRATKFRPSGICEILEQYPGTYQVANEREFGADPVGLTMLAPTACIGTHEERKVYVRSLEILRFYFGPISHLAHHFLSPFRRRPGEGLIDWGETRFLDDGVLQIAPLPGVADRATALHLAMVLHSPDLLHLWHEAPEGYLSPFGNACRPMLAFPPARQALALRGHHAPVSAAGSSARGRQSFVAWSIQSDFRPAPFSRLKIKLPKGMTEADLLAAGPEDDDLIELVRQRTALSASAHLVNAGRPGRGPLRASPMLSSVTRAFPALTRVPVEYDLPASVRRQGPRLAWREHTVTAASTASAGADKQLTGLVLRPPRLCGPAGPSAVPDRELFADWRHEAAKFSPMPATGLAYPMNLFFGALRRLQAFQAGGVVGQSPLHLVAGQVMVLQPPASWGRAAQARQIGVGFVDVDGALVYALELSRRRQTERLSLGLVARPDGEPMGTTELSAVAWFALRQLRERGRVDGRVRGLWPSGEVYKDLVSRIVPHTARRRFEEILAEDLDGLARSLFTANLAREDVSAAA